MANEKTIETKEEKQDIGKVALTDGSDLCFGREQELAILKELTEANQLVFISGTDGIGKSTFARSFIKSHFKGSSLYTIAFESGVDPLELKSNDGDTLLGDLFENIGSKDLKKPVLLLDDFENCFDLLNDSNFIKRLSGALKRDKNFKCILVLRQSYLDELLKIELEIPEISSHGIVLNKLSRSNAEKALTGVAKTNKVKYLIGKESKVIDLLGNGLRTINPSLIDIFFNHHPSIKSNDQDLEQLGDLNDLIGDWISAHLEKTSNKEIGLKILKTLVTESGQTDPKNINEIKSRFNSLFGITPESVVSDMVTELQTKRLITSSDISGNICLTVSESASWIASQVEKYKWGVIKSTNFISESYKSAQKRAHLLSEGDLAQIKLFERGLNLSPELKKFVDQSKRKVKVQKILKVVPFLIAGVIALGAFLYVLDSGRENEKQLAAAVEAAESAANSKSASSQLAEQVRIASEEAALAKRELDSALAKEAATQARAEEAHQKFLNAAYRARVAKEAHAETEKERAEIAEQQKLTQAEFEKAEEALIETGRQSMLATAVALANKSFMERDGSLKRKLALQAFEYYTKNNGHPNNSFMYNALYHGEKSALGDDYNKLEGHNVAQIQQIVVHEEDYFTLAHDGQMLQWWKHDDGFSPIPILDRFIYFWEEEEMEIIETSVNNFIVHSIAINEDGKRLINHGTNQYILSNPETDEMYVIPLEESQESPVKLFPFLSSWHIINPNQFIELKVPNEKTVNASTIDLDFTVLDAIKSLKGYYLLSTQGVFEFDGISKEINKLNITVRNAPSTLAVNPKNSQLAVGYASGELVVYDVASGGEIEELEGHLARVSSLLFSLDGKRLVSGGFDKVLNIWDMDDMKNHPIHFNDHSAFITSLHLDEDNNLLMVGEMDGTLKYYNLDDKKYKEQICAFGVEPLTEDEWLKYIGDHIPYEPYKCAQ